jgi:hypothetical protein
VLVSIRIVPGPRALEHAVRSEIDALHGRGQRQAREDEVALLRDVPRRDARRGSGRRQRGDLAVIDVEHLQRISGA